LTHFHIALTVGWADLLQRLPIVGPHRSFRTSLPLVLSAASIEQRCNESVMKGIMNERLVINEFTETVPVATNTFNETPRVC
jgi:hypothetical protein